MKAVIPAAGLGTRFLPFAKAVPKEMLPLGDRPVIHYVAEEAAAAGFDEILVILSSGKEAVARYFTRDPALERHLEQAGKLEALGAVRAVAELGRIHYTYQSEMRGLGDAVRLGKDFIGSDEAFAVLLGDTVMRGGSPLPAMRAQWESRGVGSVAVAPCRAERVSRYGVCGGREVGPGVFALEAVVEKPAPDRAPRLRDATGAELGYHAFAARYLFPREIFECIEATPPGLNGEVQLTDAMERLRAASGLLGVTWPGKRLDIGSPDGLVEAMLAMRG